MIVLEPKTESYIMHCNHKSRNLVRCIYLPSYHQIKLFAECHVAKATSLSCELKGSELTSSWQKVKIRTTVGECAQIFRSIFEPTCIYSLLYTVLKISLISYPYRCLFEPSAQKGIGREKIYNLNPDPNTYPDPELSSAVAL